MERGMDQERKGVMTPVTDATIAVGYLPASANATMYRHWALVRRQKQQLQRDIEIILLASGPPRPIPGGYVEASATLLVPDRRRRDTGNYRSTLEKALGDALVNGGWLPDDTPQHFAFGRLTFEHVPNVRATRIHFNWANEVAA